MKFCLAFWCLLLFGCSPKKNKPISVDVRLSVSTFSLPASFERLSLGSVAVSYELEWELKNKEEKDYGNTNSAMNGGWLANATFLSDRSSSSEDLTYVGHHQIWEDNSGCRCDQFRPDGAIVISKPKIKLCKPILLSREGKIFEGEHTSNHCISLEIDDFISTHISDGSSISSEIFLDFSESFDQDISPSETALCFENEAESICLNAFKGTLSTTVQ